MDIEDAASLTAWLRERQLVRGSEEIRIEVLGGGVSSRTVRVSRGGRDDLIVKQALDRLRVDVEWRCDPGRSAREVAALRWLNTNAPAGAVVPLIAFDAQHHVLVTKAVPPGHDNWKALLMAGRIEPAHVLRFGALLAHLHVCGAAQRDSLMEEFADRSYFEALRVEPFYRYPAQQLSSACAFLEALIEDLEGRTVGFVHGDYSPKNILVDRDRLVLVDHEVAHVGDPAFDVGFALAHLLSKAHALPVNRKRMAAASRWFFGEYLKRIGHEPWTEGIEARICRHAAACLLARAVGRSPLEYLDEAARTRQADAVVALLKAVPVRVDDLVGQFVTAVS